MRKIFCLTLTVILAMSAVSCAAGESAPSDANVSVSESVPIIETSEVTAMSSSQESSGGTPTFEESTTKESISTESKESEIKVPSFSLPVSTTDLPPQTDPDSYFLYGTVLPEGNYLLISITANQYALYDELGHLIKTFRYSAYEEPLDYARVLSLSGVHKYTDPNCPVDTNRDTNPDDTTYFDEFPGGYIKTIDNTMESPESDENEDLSSGDESTEYSKIISIYNYADELLYSYKEPESEYSIYQVDSNEKVTAVFVQKANEENLYSLDTCVINTSGQVVLTYSFKNLPVKPAQILSEEYLIAGSYDGPINIYDRSGKLIMEDVELINHGLSVFSDQGYLVVNIYGYFSQNGVIYDSSLNKVTEGSLDSDGFMIPGMVYDVNGISCTAIETGDRWGFDGETPVVAVGKLNDRTAIRTDFGEFEIVSELGTYAYSNNHLVIMNENETYNLYNLKTGEFLGSLPDTVDFISVEDEYFLAETWDSETNSQTFRVIDKDGNIRLVTNGEYLACSNGEYIYMIRGPYHGIADLDGNWVIRVLTWEASRDAPRDYD